MQDTIEHECIPRESSIQDSIEHEYTACESSIQDTIEHEYTAWAIHTRHDWTRIHCESSIQDTIEHNAFQPNPQVNKLCVVPSSDSKTFLAASGAAGYYIIFYLYHTSVLWEQITLKCMDDSVRFISAMEKSEKKNGDIVHNWVFTQSRIAPPSWPSNMHDVRPQWESAGRE